MRRGPGPGHVIVIDPALRKPELASLNRMALAAPLPLTYHLPAMFGMGSLHQEHMTHARAILVLGSASSVNERLDWQMTLEAWLRPHLERGMPTLGICYGHQMLAHIFGGRVDYMFPDQRKHVGMRQVTMAATPWASSTAGLVAVSHNEHVADVPSCMRVIAYSAEVAVDGLAHATLPIWSFQSHPEATPEFFADRAIAIADHALGFGHDLLDRFIRFAATRTPHLGST